MAYGDLNVRLARPAYLAFFIVLGLRSVAPAETLPLYAPQAGWVVILIADDGLTSEGASFAVSADPQNTSGSIVFDRIGVLNPALSITEHSVSLNATSFSGSFGGAMIPYELSVDEASYAFTPATPVIVFIGGDDVEVSQPPYVASIRGTLVADGVPVPYDFSRMRPEITTPPSTYGVPNGDFILTTFPRSQIAGLSGTEAFIGNVNGVDYFVRLVLRTDESQPGPPPIRFVYTHLTIPALPRAGLTLLGVALLLCGSAYATKSR